MDNDHRFILYTLKLGVGIYDFLYYKIPQYFAVVQRRWTYYIFENNWLLHKCMDVTFP